jgi:hypothetical protein
MISVRSPISAANWIDHLVGPHCPPWSTRVFLCSPRTLPYSRPRAGLPTRRWITVSLWAERLLSNLDALLAGLLAMPQADVISLVAICVPSTIDVTIPHDGVQPAAVLPPVVDLDVHAGSTPGDPRKLALRRRAHEASGCRQQDAQQISGAATSVELRRIR